MVFILFVLQIVLGAILYDAGYQFEAGDPLYSLFILIISIGGMLSIVMHYKNLRYTELFNQSGSSAQSLIMVLGLPLLIIAVGAQIWVSDLAAIVIYFLPMSDQEVHMFQRVFTGGTASLLLICVVAPLIEEMMFRGIILRGLLCHYPPGTAIALSALIFAMYHLNIYQMPVALTVGVFSGWLYYKTRSLWPSILLHVFFNATAYILFLIGGPEELLLEAEEAKFHTILQLVFGIALTLTGYYMLKRIFRKR